MATAVPKQQSNRGSNNLILKESITETLKYGTICTAIMYHHSFVPIVTRFKTCHFQVWVCCPAIIPDLQQPA